MDRQNGEQTLLTTHYYSVCEAPGGTTSSCPLSTPSHTSYSASQLLLAHLSSALSPTHWLSHNWFRMASTHKPPNPSSVANHRTRTASFVALLGVLSVPFLPYVYRYTPVLHHLPVRLPFLSTIGPTVHLDYGSFGGRAGDANGIEQFLGVPYAAPP